MKKIINNIHTAYVVTSGAYSDYRIEGVFSTKEKAEIFKKYLEKDGFSDYPEIEEYELDKPIDKLKQGLFDYRVSITKSGDIVSTMRHSFNQENYKFIGEGGPKNRTLLINHCWAKSKEHAVKIINELRVRLIAENKWGEK